MLFTKGTWGLPKCDPVNHRTEEVPKKGRVYDGHFLAFATHTCVPQVDEMDPNINYYIVMRAFD